jgi:hypothetical protein
MKDDKDKEREYQQMRGEYLSLMASVEFYLTFLMTEYLEVGNHREEFAGWLTRAPIPFGWKVSLFEKMIKDNTMLKQFGDICGQLRELYDFRNTVAHSFRQMDRTLTARGKEIPAETVTFEALQQKLEQLRSMENLIGGMVYDQLQGPIPPISADDFADWPI